MTQNPGHKTMSNVDVLFAKHRNGPLYLQYTVKAIKSFFHINSSTKMLYQMEPIAYNGKYVSSGICKTCRDAKRASFLTFVSIIKYVFKLMLSFVYIKQIDDDDVFLLMHYCVKYSNDLVQDMHQGLCLSVKRPHKT